MWNRRIPSAAEASLAKRQEASADALQSSRHIDQIRVYCEMRQAAAKGE